MSNVKENNRDVNSVKARKFTTQDFIRLILPNWYWYLAALVTFGTITFFVMPYVEASVAAYYDEVRLLINQ